MPSSACKSAESLLMVLSIMRMVSRTNSSSSTTRIRTRWSSETLGAHVDVIMQDGCSRAIPQRVRACEQQKESGHFLFWF